MGTRGGRMAAAVCADVPAGFEGVIDDMDWLGESLYQWRIRVVLPYVKGNLLDLACGANALVKRHGRGVGADRYQHEGAVDVVIDDAGKLPFEDGLFDTVTVLAALNHIPNRSEALAETYRVLKPGGRVIVTMIPPGISWAWHRLRGESDKDQVDRPWMPGERFGLTRAETRQLLAAAGFREIRQHRFMFGVNTLTVGCR